MSLTAAVTMQLLWRLMALCLYFGDDQTAAALQHLLRLRINYPGPTQGCE